jgi:hypothetical protein
MLGQAKVKRYLNSPEVTLLTEPKENKLEVPAKPLGRAAGRDSADDIPLILAEYTAAAIRHGLDSRSTVRRQFGCDGVLRHGKAWVACGIGRGWTGF